MLMTVFLLAGTVVNAVGSEAGDENTANLPEVPEVVIVGNNVNGAGEFLEVSLRVSGWRFQSVGVVLSYDTGVLTPVDWSNPAQPLEVKSSWTTVMPTKGTDLLSGKPALITVDDPAENPVVPDDSAEDEGTEDGDEPVSPPAVPSRAYLYLGADALQAMALENERVVTVRFAITEGKTVILPEAGHETEESNHLCLATNADILDTSIPGMPLMTTTLDQNDLPVEHPYQKVLSADGEETLYTVRFASEAGPSVNTGTSAGGGDYAITFFDWDGRVIDAISTGEDAGGAVTDWQAQPAVQNRLNGKAGYAFNGWLVVYQANDGSGLQTVHGSLTSVKDRESAPVPAGQSNGKLYSEDLFSHYNGKLTDITTEALRTKNNLTNAGDGSQTSVLLQATYKTKIGVNHDDTTLNDDMSTLNDDARYKFSAPTFYQYGKSTSNEYGFYAVRVDVSRDGTLRADSPTVQVEVFVNGSQYAVTVKVDLENTDETSFEVVVPKTVTSVAYHVRDTYGMTNWINGTSRSLRISDTCSHAVIIREGAFSTIVDEAKSGLITDALNSGVNAICFSDAGFTGVTEANLSTVTANLAAKTAQVNAGVANRNDWRTLTRNEVQNVITNGV